MEEVNSLVAELRRFSSDVAELAVPADPKLVMQFEAEKKLSLPNDYKLIIAQVNGFSMIGNEVYGVHGNSVTLSLENVYQREHFDVFYPQPSYLVPFSGDGRGNFYCFDTRHKSADKQSNSVVFWVSNYPYTEDDSPAIAYNSFLEFVDEVIISWTLEVYDYEGNEK